MKTKRHSFGMTLVEVLTVITIITLLAGTLGMLVPSVTRGLGNTRARSDIHKLMAVLQLYNRDTGTYPDAFNHTPTTGGTGTRVELLPSLSKTANDDNGRERIFTDFVWALTSSRYGWSRPGFFDVFTSIDLDKNGVFVDPWAKPYAYLSKHQYNSESSTGRPIAGTKLGDQYANSDSYQIYSSGASRFTFSDQSGRAGTEAADINNWMTLVE